MVELGFMPKDLAAHGSGNHRIPVALSQADHGRRVEQSAEGLQDVGRAGARRTRSISSSATAANEVSTWYFEVWNEPDIVYWHGTPEEYFKLYDYAVAGVRDALPNAMVGGPASTGPGAPKRPTSSNDFLKHCLQRQERGDGKPIPLDFISFHPKGRPALVDGHVRMGLANELDGGAERLPDRREVSAAGSPAHHSERGRSRRAARPVR